MSIKEKFIGLDNSHVASGKKQLLYCEMEILTSLQKYSRYQKFRKGELAIKNLLKKVILEIRKEMDSMMEYIPQIKEDFVKVEARGATSLGKRDLLEEEIQNIRRKIASIDMN